MSQVTEELLFHEAEFLFRKWQRQFRGRLHQNAFLRLLSTAPGISPEHHLLWDCSAQSRRSCESCSHSVHWGSRGKHPQGKKLPAAALHPRGGSAPAMGGGVCVYLPHTLLWEKEGPVDNSCFCTSLWSAINLCIRRPLLCLPALNLEDS